MSEVLICIKGAQQQGDEQENIELMTQGKVERKDGCHIITYEDVEQQGSSSVTVITVCDKVVTMERTGYLDTHFVFETGKTYTTSYNTPFGSLDVSLYPTLVEAKVENGQGKIELEYVLSIAGAQIVNRLNVSYAAEEAPSREMLQ